METKQVQQLKLNVTNISSFLKQSNKTYFGLKKKNSDLLSNQVKEQKLQKKEKKIETNNITGFGLGKVGNEIASTGGSIFDKILGFGSYILAGILVNSLPEIFKKVMEFVDNIVNFVTPIYSGFRLLQAIITKEPLDNPELSPEKKRFTDELKKAKLEVDKIQKNLGIGGFILTPIQLFINEVIRQFGGNSIVLAKKGGKEGFLDTNTDTFFEKQFTSAERIKYETMRRQGMSGAASTPSGGETSSLGSTGKTLSTLSDQDFDDLAYAVSAEAQRNTDDEYGVAANVLTRVADPNYPNTIMGVFTQGSHSQQQYAAYWEGKSYRDPRLAKKLKANRNKIAEAMAILNGRTEFKGRPMYHNMGAGDIKFHPLGNFYHYANQVGKYDPPPKNPPQFWKRFVNTSPQLKPSTKRGDQASALNTTMGEEGSTTIIYARQQVIT